MSKARSRVELNMILFISMYEYNATIYKLNGISFEKKSQL